MLLALLLLLAAPPTFDEAYRAGLLALQRNDLTAARDNLRTASKMAPANGRVWVALAQVYWKSGESAKARDTAAKAAGLSSGDAILQKALAEFYFGVAQPLLNEQKFSDALVVLEDARKHVGKNAQIELARGVAYYGLRRFDDAGEAFLSTIAVAPETDQPYLFLGKILDQIPARQAAATERFAEYEAAHPGSAAGYLLHAQGLNAQAIEPRKSEELLEKSIAIDGTSATAHFELGNVLDRLQEFEKAAKEFERAIALNPSDAATHYRLARDYERLGRHEDALKEREIHASLVKAQEPLR